MPLNRELANGEPGTVNSEPGTAEPGTWNRQCEAPRRRRRAIDARAVVDRPAPRRLRRDAGRKRPRGDRSSRSAAVRSAGLGHQDARHDRRRRAARREAHRPGHPRHHDHGVCLGRHRHRGDAPGRARLPQQAVRRRRAEDEGAQRPRAAPAPPGERAAEARARQHPPVREHRRAQRQDARHLQADRADRAHRQHGARHRRIGHRQGVGGARHPLLFAAPRSAVRRAQLRRAARDAPRIGAVRPHEGRVHRREREQERADRGGREGHAVPRRDRRDDADDAGEAAARAAGAEVPPPGRRRRARGRDARHRRHESGSDQDGRGRASSARTCSTASTSSRFICRRCASARRTFRCWPSTSW